MLGRGEFEKRYLPRPAALGIAVEVELVGDEDADVGVLALAQRHVRDDFRRRADDGRRCVDRCVAGDHSDIVRSEGRDEFEELLRDERFERGRVIGGAAFRQCGEDRRQGHHRLARARGSGDYEMLAFDGGEEGFFLMRVERSTGRFGPGDEFLIDRFIRWSQAVCVLDAVEGGVQRRGSGGSLSGHGGSHSTRVPHPWGHALPASARRGTPCWSATIAKPAEDGDPGSPSCSSFPVREGTFGAGGSDLHGGVDGGKLNAFASLAQLVEQLTLNQWVLGSSPRRCTG